jgi:hypothetical protein
LQIYNRLSVYDDADSVSMIPHRTHSVEDDGGAASRLRQRAASGSATCTSCFRLTNLKFGINFGACNAALQGLQCSIARLAMQHCKPPVIFLSSFKPSF